MFKTILFEVREEHELEITKWAKVLRSPYRRERPKGILEILTCVFSYVKFREKCSHKFLYLFFLEALSTFKCTYVATSI